MATSNTNGNNSRPAAKPPAYSANNSPANTPATTNPSLAATLKAYRVPLILFVASLFFQIVVLPRAFPTSHYDVLGIKRYSSVEEVKEAYEKLTENWNSDIKVPSTIDFIKVRYAFELLTNELWKRDYDIFSIDEQYHVIEKFKEQHTTRSISKIDLPILEATYFDHDLDVINPENLISNGIGIVCASPKALEATKSAKSVRVFFDWNDYLKFYKLGTYWPYTPSIQLLYGLRAALDLIFEEGLDNVIARHSRLAKATRSEP